MGARTVHHVCFHGIGTPGRTVDADEARYWVSRDSFLRLLDAIASRPGTAISFDDGNASDVEVGLPALLDRGLTATFFVLAGRLDRPGSLSTADVAGLPGAGMRVGSHGMDHVSWRGMPAGVRHRELVEARAVIAEVTGRPVTEAALPRGQYDRTTLSSLRRLGYARVHTSDRRPATAGGWLQHRFSAVHDDTPETLLDALRRPSAARRAALGAKGLVKRWR